MPEPKTDGIPVSRLSGGEAERDRTLRRRFLHQAVRNWRRSGWPLDRIGMSALRAHLIVLADRLQSGMPLEPLSSSILAQIDAEAIQVAQTMLTPWLARFRQPPASSEVALVALHLVATRERIARHGGAFSPRNAKRGKAVRHDRVV